jgi:threonine/homoserine/homoserine lactone efflux protein
MPSIDTLITFTLAAFIMNISPGPSNLYVLARSISQGIKGGLVATAGLAVGSLVHLLATILGLSAVLRYSPNLYLLIKVLGALYLIYLGVSYWRSSAKKDDLEVKKSHKKSLFKIFRESVIVEVTNPKTALFFLAFLPQFVSPESGAVTSQLLVLGLIVTISAIPCDVLVTVFSNKMANSIRNNPKAQTIQERVSGSILLGLGSFIVADEVIHKFDTP